MRAVLSALLLFMAAISPAYPLDTTDRGWIPVRVEDSVRSHCIDRTKEAITLDLRRIITSKEKGWFTEDAEIDVLLDVKLSGSTNGDAKALTLPRAFAASLKGGAPGIYSVGIEESLLNSYPLSVSSGQRLTNMHVDIRIVNQAGTTALTDVVRGLVDITKSLPFPSTPFQAGLNYADSYANGLLDKVTARKDVSGDIVKLASFQLNFGANASSCAGGRFEMTGTKAMVRGVTGDEKDGIINILDPTRYCFRVVTLPVYTVQVKVRGKSASCGTDGSDWVDLHNPYIALVLSADPAVEAKGTGLQNGFPTYVSIPSRETVQRCAANGIAFGECTSAGNSVAKFNPDQMKRDYKDFLNMRTPMING